MGVVVRASTSDASAGDTYGQYRRCGRPWCPLFWEEDRQIGLSYLGPERLPDREPDTRTGAVRDVQAAHLPHGGRHSSSWLPRWTWSP